MRARSFPTSMVLLLFATCANASDRQVYPEAVGSQTLFYDAGTPWIVNSGPIEVAGSLTVADDSSAWLGLIIRNHAEAAVTVREQDITANFGATKLKVWTAEELVAQQHRKGNWRKAFAGLAAGLNSYAAGQSGRYTTTGTFNGNVQTTYGSGGYSNSNFNGSYIASGTDPVAQQRALEAAARQNQALVERVQQQGDLDEQSLNAFAFHSQTVVPGGLVTGHLKIELPRRSSTPEPLFVLVQIGERQVAFFIGLDGPYTDAQRAKASEIYAMIEPHPAPALIAATDNVAQENQAAATTEAAAQQPTATPAPAKRVPRIGDTDYFTERTITERTKTVSHAAHPGTEAETATETPAANNVKSPRANSVYVLSVLSKKLEPCPSDVASTCVALDIAWQQPTASQFVMARTGRLLLRPDSSGPELSVEWTVPGELAPGKTIEQRGIEFPLGKAGMAKQWLPTIDPTSIRASFVPATDN